MDEISISTEVLIPTIRMIVLLVEVIYVFQQRKPSLTKENKTKTHVFMAGYSLPKKTVCCGDLPIPYFRHWLKHIYICSTLIEPTGGLYCSIELHKALTLT